MKIILYSFLLGFILSFQNDVFAQDTFCSFELDTTLRKLNVKGHISTFSTNINLTTKQAYDSILLSSRTEHCTPNTAPGFIKEKFWVSFDVSNISNRNMSLILEVDNPHIDTIEVYAKSENDKDFKVIGISGDQMPFKKRIVENRRFIFPLEIDQSEELSILVLVDKRTGATSFPMNLWNADDFNITESRSMLFHSVYFGGIVFVSFFSIMIGFIVRDKRILIYGLYVLSMGLLIFTALGYSFQYIYPWSSTFNNYSRTFTLVVTFGLSMLFSISFLKIEKYLNIEYWILTAVYVFFFTLAVSNFLFLDFMYRHIYGVLNTIYIVMFIGLIAIAVSLFKLIKIDRKTTLTFIFGILALALGAVVSILIEYGVFTENIFEYANTLLLGSIIEVLIFSLSFVFEIKNIYEKRNILILEKSAQQKKLVEAYINGSEEEGSRISKELHDNIGSRLAIIKSGLESYVQDVPRLKEELNSVFTDVKDISNTLSPNQLQILGFQDAVKSLILQLQEIGLIKVNWFSDDLPQINHNKELQLYRILQEVVQNIIKHSDASEVDFQMIREDDDKFAILIDDNGRGFDPLKVDSKSLGISNMKLRAETINARIEISSRINEGTHIVIWCDNFHISSD
jgi:signal transduction histidine kinase